jgi:hypothetical protein
VHKGSEYKVIQNKMSVPKRRPAPQPKQPLSAAPKHLLSNAPNLGGWVPFLSPSCHAQLLPPGKA